MNKTDDLIRKASEGDTEAIQELKNTDINAKDSKDGLTALFWAMLGKRTEVVCVLLKAEADTEVAKDKHGMTVLIRAANRGDAEIVRKLVKFEADKKAKDNKFSQTAYDYWKQEHKDHPEYQDILQLLKP